MFLRANSTVLGHTTGEVWEVTDPADIAEAGPYIAGRHVTKVANPADAVTLADTGPVLIPADVDLGTLDARALVALATEHRIAIPDGTPAKVGPLREFLASHVDVPPADPDDADTPDDVAPVDSGAPPQT